MRNESEWGKACSVHHGTQATHMMIAPCGGITSLCPPCATRMMHELAHADTVSCAGNHAGPHEGSRVTYAALSIYITGVN